MILIDDCYPGPLYDYSAVDIAYSSSASTTIELFYFTWNIPAKPEIFIGSISPSMLMNVLGWHMPPSGCTAAFVVLVFSSTYTAALLIIIILLFPCWLVYPGGIGETCTPYDINNSLTSGLKLLKKVVENSNGNTTSRGNVSTLMRNWVKITFTNWLKINLLSLLWHILRHVETLFFSSVGVVTPRYVLFRYFFTISNCISFTYRRGFHWSFQCNVMKIYPLSIF